MCIIYAPRIGYNSRWILSILDRLIPVAPEGSSNEWSNIVLATVFLGANDSVSNAEGQLVPVEEYKENLRAIIRHLQRCSHDAHIALITPPKVDSSLWPTRSIERVSVYADAVRALAAEEAGAGRRVHLVDLWEGDLCVEIPDLRDGLHLGFVGSNKVATGIMRLVRANIPELFPEGDGSSCPMPSHFPAWSAFLDVAGDGVSVNVPQSPLKAASVASEWTWN
jgi:lysophospholipase L1-like esterase